MVGSKQVWSVDELNAHDRAIRALRVIANTQHIVHYLKVNDPKALGQVAVALAAYPELDSPLYPETLASIAVKEEGRTGERRRG